MSQTKMKRENRKALPVFFAVMIVCCLVGGVFGYSAAVFGLDRQADVLKKAAAFFAADVAPWLMVALAVMVPIVCVPIYRGAKRLIAEWDGEDEELSEKIDAKISTIVWLTGMVMILSFFLQAAVYSGGFSMFDSTRQTALCFLSIAALVVILAETTLLQQKSVDAAKETHPEKNGVSVYDMRFQKKWMDNCDEAEKIMIGRCAVKAYSVTNKVCCVLAVVLAVSALVFDIGFLPSGVVCLVWIVNHSVYCRESVRAYASGAKGQDG